VSVVHSHSYQYHSQPIDLGFVRWDRAGVLLALLAFWGCVATGLLFLLHAF